MNIISCWTVRQLRRWFTSLAPDILFLLETKIKKVAAEKLKEMINFTNAIGVSNIGLTGGLCLMWNDAAVSFTMTSYSQNHICGEVVSKGDVKRRFICVYGWSAKANKHKMIRHGLSCVSYVGTLWLDGTLTRF